MNATDTHRIDPVPVERSDHGHARRDLASAGAGSGDALRADENARRTDEDGPLDNEDVMEERRLRPSPPTE